MIGTPNSFIDVFVRYFYQKWTVKKLLNHLHALCAKGPSFQVTLPHTSLSQHTKCRRFRTSCLRSANSLTFLSPLTPLQVLTCPAAAPALL